ncbi:hypothetical protein H6P81_008087 [Aristolochia fimbriata]|uniref:Uncharacterized protein n=1 Tax=Aristolochia fimbriata TaxID=158543 RepID=A0AAV7F299_ARIFI|nr:hypothetical protein H6P81_008087 [Aristolochia fimbriata]
MAISSLFRYYSLSLPLFFFLLIVSTSPPSMARLLISAGSDEVLQSFPSTVYSGNTVDVLPRQDGVLVDLTLISTSADKSRCGELLKMRYGSTLFNVLPKGYVPPSGPSRDTNSYNHN